MEDWKKVLATLGGNTENENEDEVKQEHEVNRKKRVGVVYSSNPHFKYSDNSQTPSLTLPKQQQKLRISMERAGRGGKTVTLVKGFIGAEEDITSLCRLLKQKCGVGGSVKDGDIIIQGNHRQRLTEMLKNEGYTQTR